MATKKIEYPDYSKPLESNNSNGSDYPDYSIPNDAGAKQVANINSQIENISNQPEQRRTPQIQEEFSNPSAVPGFENLSKKDQLERLKFSQFDPANQGLGGFVSSGTYENPANRLLGSVAGSALGPEISAGGRFIAPILNSLNRIGKGTAGSLAFQSPEFKDEKDFKNALTKDLGWNTALEAATTPLRTARKAAEYSYPIKYAQKKADTIRQEYKDAVRTQKESYNPVFKKYGHEKVTNDPKKYLNLSKKDERYLTPNVTKAIEDFSEDPTFKKLHDLQSMIGKNQSSVANNSSKINTYQTLKSIRDNLNKKAQDFLSKDKEALAQYNQGIDITKNLVEPFKVNKDLRSIAFGTIKKLTPDKLQKAIREADEKVLYTKGSNAFTAIPESHSLKNHLRDIDKAIDTGKLIESSIPLGIGSILGTLTNPSPWGAAGGAIAGSTLGKIAGKLGSPSFGELVQNPSLKKVIKNYLSPTYYGSGRAAIDEFGNK